MADFLSPGSWWFILFEGLLIVLFTYFYTAVQFNPTEQADNLKKYGGFIPGVRPGRPTAIYLDRVVSRLTLPGAIYLALIAEFPNIIFRYLPESNRYFPDQDRLVAIFNELGYRDVVNHDYWFGAVAQQVAVVDGPAERVG